MGRLESISFSIIGAFAFCSVWMRGSVQSELVGLALVYAIQLTAMLQRTVQLGIMVNQQMTACERVRSFESIAQEPALQTADDGCLPLNWPQGGVSFRDVRMRYRDGDLVLKGVSFEVVRGERLGICGRTGSGKSSLINALFRIVEPCGGSIHIDGADICKLGLHTLRGNLAIIPQDPVIFSGSLRKNLDPFGSISSDKVLSDGMRSAGLEELLQSSEGLDLRVAQNGENLSQGQRQLLCIARVIIRPARITVLDEATSAMDAETDRAVQEALSQHWRTSGEGEWMTMLTIAHRLGTIFDYDKILVLSSGQVAEFGSPQALRQNGGIFAQMIEDSH